MDLNRQWPADDIAMISRVTNCDDARLRRLLSAGGDDPAVEEHVEHCLRCQSRLADLAAGADEWRTAREFLQYDESHDLFAAEVRERPWSTEIRSGMPGARPAAWTETMARQLLAAPSHPEMLGRLGRYEVERLIGSGGMGIVFKGFDTELNRPVAIKILAPHLAGSGAARQRFSREARAAAAVVHEHVVAIHNVESDGSASSPSSEARPPFLVMQYVAGDSLQARIDRQGPLALREILRIAHQTASGLAAAHAQGLVHRDVKPSNILLEQGVERALLTDFGLARAADDASLTHTGYMPGTPHYMSPEQACGEAVDARSDLFSLGSVMYAMCTGRPPFRADTTFGVLRRITDAEPRPIQEVNSDMPVWLAGLIGKLLAKNPADRFASSEEVADVLAQCLAHVQQNSTSSPPACLRRVGQAQRRPTWILALATIIAVVFVALGTASYFLATRRGEQASDNPWSTQSAPESPSALDWDTAANEIQSLTTDVNALEQQSHELWGSAQRSSRLHQAQEE
jgi:eukaryotic-like serine/threonine-protein kinase